VEGAVRKAVAARRAGRGSQPAGCATTAMSLSRAAFYRGRDAVTRLEHGGCRVSLANCTAVLRAALERWEWPLGDTAPLTADQRVAVEQGLGPLLAATVTGTSFLKGEERTQAVLGMGTGPARAHLAMVEASRTGEVRARFQPTTAERVAAAVSASSTLHLHWSKVLYGNESPYVSIVALEEKGSRPGRVERLWNHAYKQSEQVPTSVFTRTELNEAGNDVLFCGGIAIQGLVDPRSPSRDPQQAVKALAGQVRKALASRAPLSKLLECNGAEWFNDALGLPSDRFAIMERGEDHTTASAYPIQMFCPCSPKRYALKLASAVANVDELFADEDNLEATCEFCNAKHVVTRELVSLTKKQLNN